MDSQMCDAGVPNGFQDCSEGPTNGAPGIFKNGTKMCKAYVIPRLAPFYHAYRNLCSPRRQGCHRAVVSKVVVTDTMAATEHLADIPAPVLEPQAAAEHLAAGCYRAPAHVAAGCYRAPPLIKTTVSMEYEGAVSFDGFKGKFFADLALFVDLGGFFVVRGTCANVAKDLTFTKDGVTIKLEGSTKELQSLAVGASVTFINNYSEHPQLGGCTFESVYLVRAVEEWDDEKGVYNFVLQLSSSPSTHTCSIFVDLNMHNPEAPGPFKPQNVYMFGETMQAAAVLALTNHVGVNVLSGTENKYFAEGQFGVLRRVARSPMAVTSTESSVMGSTAVKVKLDRITTFISEAFKNNPQETVRVLRQAFTRDAIEWASATEQGQGAELLKAAVGVDVTDWKDTMTVAIFNRLTLTSNNVHFDMSAAQIALLGNLLKESSVARLLIFGDKLTKSQQTALLHSSLQVVDLTQFWQRDSFTKCFGEGRHISAQCYVQLVLQDYVSLCLGPHSGGTDYCGLMGLPVIFWTSSDHPAHPRMPRLTEYCAWWWCVPVGSTDAIKAARDEAGFPNTGKDMLTKAIQYALAAVRRLRSTK